MNHCIWGILNLGSGAMVPQISFRIISILPSQVRALLSFACWMTVVKVIFQKLCSHLHVHVCWISKTEREALGASGAAQQVQVSFCWDETPWPKQLTKDRLVVQGTRVHDIEWRLQAWQLAQKPRAHSSCGYKAQEAEETHWTGHEALESQWHTFPPARPHLSNQTALPSGDQASQHLSL